EEAVLAVQDLVARAGISTHQQADQLVGAGAADDLVSRQTMPRGDGDAQLLLAAIGIAMQFLREVAVGADGCRRRAERALIGGKPDHPLLSRQLRIATLVGFDIEDSRTRLHHRIPHAGAASSSAAVSGTAYPPSGQTWLKPLSRLASRAKRSSLGRA